MTDKTTHQEPGYWMHETSGVLRPVKGEEAVSDLWECYEPEDDAYMEPDPEFASVPCPTCNGHGVVNPLTAPSWFLCVTTTTCPTCDGTGEF